MLFGLTITPAQAMTLIVTPGKSEHSMEETPASASTLGQADLEARAVRELDQAARHLPNLYLMGQGTGGRSMYLFLRGVGATHNDPAVGFLVDDVPMSSEGVFDVDFSDVERVEVLRGPQGSLHGRNALGGVVHVISRPAVSGKPSAQLKADAGNFGLHREALTLTTPIKNTDWHLRLAADQTQRDGYSRNLVSGRLVESVDQYGGQLRLSWLPVGATDADLLIRHQHADNGGFGLNPPGDLGANPRQLRQSVDGLNHKNQTTPSLKIHHDAPSFGLTSITAGDFWRNDALGDADYSQADLAVVTLREEKTLFSQELRIHSPRQEKGPDHWLFGVYAAQDRFFKDGRIAYQPGAVAAGLMPVPFTDHFLDRTVTRDFAIFGEVTRGILPDLELTVGLRFNHLDREGELSRAFEWNGAPMAGTATAAMPAFNEQTWLPKYALLYHLNPDYNLYATLAKGYRNGGFNSFASDPADQRFASESLWNHEIGIKSRKPIHGVTWSAALFEIEWHNQQVQLIQPNFAPLTRNAGQSRARGGELEMTWTPAETTRLSLAYGHTDARFLSYRDPVLGADYAGRRVPVAPLHTLAIGVEHERDVTDQWRWFGRADLEGRGNIFWDAANTAKQRMEPLLHARTGLRYANWELALWSHNLLDATVQVFGEASPTLGHRIGYAEPRTVGLSLGMKYP
ncbi:MAG: TonB-dependent receptor [Magnetococcales bacterium]|nr:TonB-dependent receptor [Magnetococcales bacterium]